jgi:hypothetical protein
VVAAAVLLTTGMPAPAQAYDITATHVLATPAQAGSTLAYWLNDDGRALTQARPYITRNMIAPSPVSTGGPVPDGRPGVVPAAGGKIPAATSRNVNLPRTAGKAFFLGPGNRPYWCAATSIQSGNRNLVATAAHCVYDIASGVPFRRWIFVPGSSKSATPWGVYVGKQVFTHHDFATYRDLDRDYAFVGVYNGIIPSRVPLPTPARYAAFPGRLKYATITGGTKSYVGVKLADGGRLGDRVGGQGLAYNLQVGGPLLIFGYPAKPGATTATTRSYGTPFKTQDLAIKAEGLVGMRASTPSVAGSSWLTRYSSARGLGYLNGMTIGVSGTAGISPYFDGELFSVYDAARRLQTGSFNLRPWA